MKKILIVVGVVLLYVIVGFGVASKWDYTHSVIVKKISQAIRFPVDVERVSLALDKGPAVRFENFSVYSDADKKNKLIQFSQGRVAVRWMALFRGQSPSSCLEIFEADFSALQLKGHLSLSFEGDRGHLILPNGVLVDTNLLREVIQKISIIPGARNVLQERLPDFYKAKSAEPDTILKPIDFFFTVQNGKILFDRLLIASDLVGLEISGELSLDKTFRVKANLHLDQELSRVMVDLVPNIQFLVNSQGVVSIPVQLKGQLPEITVTPDINQKLFASAAKQLVIAKVRNLLDKQVPTEEAGLALNSLLNRVIGKKNPEEEQGRANV